MAQSSNVDRPVWADHGTMPFQLVLEGGAMRSLFTCGAVDFLLDRGVVAESVIGTSAGAICGYNYVAGATGRMAYFSMEYRGDWRFMSMRSKLLTGNYVGSEYIFDTLPNKVEPLDQSWFTKSPAKLVSVATDMERGCADYHDYDDEHDLQRGMRYMVGGASVPFANRAVDVDGKRLLDGGVADVVPFRRDHREYAGRQVVILTRPRGFRQKTTSEWVIDRARYARYPRFAELLGTRFERNNAARRAVERLHDDGGVFAIWPKEEIVAGTAERDTDKLFAAYIDGVRTMAEQWPALREYLGIDGKD